MVQKLLVICGPSGSGKTTVEKFILTNFPNKYCRTIQYSTRSMRFNESQYNPYVFVDTAYFNSIKHSLIGVVDDLKLWKNEYGTANCLSHDKINVAIFSIEGINDLLKAKEDGRISKDIQIFVLGLDVSNEILLNNPDMKREGRNEFYLDCERKVFEHADYIDKITDISKMRDLRFLFETKLPSAFKFFN